MLVLPGARKNARPAEVARELYQQAASAASPLRQKGKLGSKIVDAHLPTGSLQLTPLRKEAQVRSTVFSFFGDFVF